MEVFDAAGRAPLIDEAAQIWADATAARDGRDEVPPLDAARPVIQGVLDRSHGHSCSSRALPTAQLPGFAAIEPAPGSDGTVAQITYFGVRPPRWGQGIGETLLLQARQRPKAAGYAGAELSVSVDNHRATALYERLGWQAVGPPTAHPKTGKPERRYELHL